MPGAILEHRVTRNAPMRGWKAMERHGLWRMNRASEVTWRYGRLGFERRSGAGRARITGHARLVMVRGIPDVTSSSLAGVWNRTGLDSCV